MPSRLSTRFTVYRREVLIRLNAFKTFIILFLIVSLSGMTILKVKLDLPLTMALYEAISLMFFSSSLDFPSGDLFLELLWIIFPLFGLILLADGLSGIGTAIKFGDPTSEIWNQEVAKIMKDHVVIVGIGNVGFKILKELIKMELEITVIDKSTEEGRDEFEEFQADHRIPTIYGDASREGILEKASIEDARTMIIAIDDDLLNLKIALLVRKLNPNLHLVVRMFDLEFGEQIQEKVGIDKIISTSSLSVPHFIEAIKSK